MLRNADGYSGNIQLSWIVMDTKAKMHKYGAKNPYFSSIAVLGLMSILYL